MKRKHWLLLGLMGCLTAIVFWPAYALKQPLAQATNGRLQLLNAQGTIWSGQATLGVSSGTQVQTLPGLINWKPLFFRDEALLGMSLSHPNLTQDLNVGVNSSGTAVTAGQARLPASWLSALGAPFNTIQPEGELQLAWDQINSESGTLSLEIVWRDAQSTLSSVRPLGEYRAVLTGRLGETLHLDLSTTQGALHVEGKGQIVPGKRMQFQGFAWATEQSKPALRGILSQMGQPQNGRYRLNFF